MSLFTLGQPLVLVATKPWYSACWVAAHVGDLRGFGGADLQHRVRLFGACGKDAPWARVLEAAANDVDAVGQQGCGQGVAFKAFVALTVERKRQDFITVDAATVGQAIDLAHTFSPEALAVN